MKKRYLLFIILFLIFICGTGYFIFYKSNRLRTDNSLNVNMHDLYFELKNHKKNVTTSSGEYTLDEYLFNQNNEESSDNYQYAFVDLDSDGILEIVFYYGFIFSVIHYDDGVLYGYDEINYFSNLKSDGTFIGRNENNNEAIVTLSFDKEIVKKNILAYRYSGKYVIDGKDVSENEYNVYFDNQKQKDGLIYTYVYDNSEYDSIDFSKINDSSYDNKKEYEEKIFKVLELYNGPGYGSGTSFCGNVDFSKNIIRDNHNYYYLSINYNTRNDLYNYWRDYLSNEFLYKNDDKFIEEKGKLYCSSYGKDGGSIYNFETSKFTIKSLEDDKFIIIGRVFFKDARGNNNFDDNSYIDVVFNFIKNDKGNFVINNFIRFYNLNNN